MTPQLVPGPVSGDEFLCTGKPKCYLHTKAPLGDGTLRFDYRFEPDPKVTDPVKLAAHNTGVLLFIQEPHAIWPKSIEVQGKYSEMGQLRPKETQLRSNTPTRPESPRGGPPSRRCVELDRDRNQSRGDHGLDQWTGRRRRKSPVNSRADSSACKPEGHRLRYRRYACDSPSMVSLPLWP